MDNKPESDSERRIKDIIDALDDQKARDIAIYRFSESNSLADAFIIATATSGRHAQAMAESAALACKTPCAAMPRMEGHDSAQWILVDCNDVIVHIFQEDVRNFYRLDELCRHSALKEQQS